MRLKKPHILIEKPEENWLLLLFNFQPDFQSERKKAHVSICYISNFRLGEVLRFRHNFILDLKLYFIYSVKLCFCFYYNCCNKNNKNTRYMH